MRSQASPFRLESTGKQEVGEFLILTWDLLIKSTKVLRACVKPSVKIFPVALRIADGTDGGLKEAFVSQCHSTTLPLH